MTESPRLRGVQPWGLSPGRLSVTGGRDLLGLARDSSMLPTMSCWMFCQLSGGTLGREVGTEGREAGQDPSDQETPGGLQSKEGSQEDRVCLCCGEPLGQESPWVWGRISWGPGGRWAGR